MAKNDELLSETPAVDEADAELGVEDVTVEVADEDFDFGAFVQGVRATRRAVTLVMRGDLVAEMETLVTDIEAAEKRDESTDALMAEYQAARTAFEGSKRRVVVEAKSTDWLTRLHKTLKKSNGLDVKNAEDRAEILLHQVAGQIVHPTKGVTVKALQHLFETAEPEVDKLWQAVNSANKGQAGVSPDFSRGR